MPMSSTKEQLRGRKRNDRKGDQWMLLANDAPNVVVTKGWEGGMYDG